jgi:MoaA/NifB/PqqE/SkfB family radical SAM enzyme
MKHHAGSGDNVSFLRLLRQGLPYYFFRNGFAFPPMTIFLTINKNCNLRCQMCDIGQRNKESIFYRNLIGEEGEDFPLERYKGLIDECAHFKPYISITTTEPLLYKDLIPLIEYTVQSGLNINITTNGFLLEKFAEALVAAGLSRLSVSLDGPREIHDRLRGVKGTYDRVMAGLRAVEETKRRMGVTRPTVMLHTSITDYNHADLVRMVEGVPLDTIYHWNFKLMVFVTEEIARMHNEQFGYKYEATQACLAGDVDVSGIDIDVLYEQSKLLQESFGDKLTLYYDVSKEFLYKYFQHPEQFMDDSRCVLPWFVAQLTANGDMIGLTRCYPTTFGNVMDRHFLDVWNGPEMRRFRKDLKRYGRFPACSRCDGVLYR